MKDLIILGNGIAGMTAALYAKRANLDFKIVGRDEYDFGQIANAIMVENYPGVDPMPGFDLAMKIHDQLEDNGIKIEEHEILKIWPGITPENRVDWRIAYKDREDRAKAIIYALGAKHRKLDCMIMEGIPIHYCALCDGALYKDKTVAIIGGGDVAFTQAEYLSKICKEVTIVMCDENVTASPSTFERVKNIENINIIYNFPVAAILKTTHGFGIYKEKPNSQLYTHYGPHVDGIFVAIGMKPNIEPISEKEIICPEGYIYTNDKCCSNRLGFFAAGDIRGKTTRQAITAAADGAIAVNSVCDYLSRYWSK